MSDLTGELIDGRYKLLSLIAAGGMASIYKATDNRLDRHVAVKIMHPHLANDEEFVNRFIREAKATAALSHPNIVSIQDQGWNEGGTPAVFIVMEYIDGFTLRDLLTDKGPLSVSDFLRYMIPVTSALAAAHRLGISHRDLKPENILISNDDRIKIADFGLARGGVLGSTMTVESSIVLGSVSYLSPEQVQRGISDSRSDIYSLGIVYFEILTGEKPYEGESPIQIAYKHVNERIGAPSLRRPGIPEMLDVIVLKATSPNPDQRQKNGQELLDELQQLQIVLNPKKNQMSLELDLPINPPIQEPIRKKRGHEEIRIGDTKVERPDFTQSNLMNPKEEPMGNTTELHRKKAKKVRRNRALVVLIILLIVGGGTYKFLTISAGISVPSVVGMNITEATKTLELLGLHVSVGSRTYDPLVPRGKVISSNPGGGRHISKNGTVLVYLSKGAEGQPTPTKAPPATSPSPVTTSARITIDSYLGKSGDQAQSELTSAGLVVSQNFGFSDAVSAGNVMAQDPAGTTPIQVGSTVTIVISQGPELVPIPNVFSMTRTAAITALENVQLQAKVIVQGAGTGKHVTRISPKAGTEVKRGSTVTITLG